MSQKPLTDYEVGQELIKYVDTIFETLNEFEKSHPVQFSICKEAALQIGDCFNHLHKNTHEFGINSHAKNDDIGFYKIGQLVQPDPSCRSSKKFRIVGNAVFHEQWWYPVIEDNASDPTFFKAFLLQKAEPLKDGDICPICAEQFHGKDGCECEGSKNG